METGNHITNRFYLDTILKVLVFVSLGEEFSSNFFPTYTD